MAGYWEHCGANEGGEWLTATLLMFALKFFLKTFLGNQAKVQSRPARLFTPFTLMGFTLMYYIAQRTVLVKL